MLRTREQKIGTMAESRFILRSARLSPTSGIKLAEGTFLVGRDSSCSLVLTDSSVSRRHAEFTIKGVTLTVRDLNSRNGTFVDGERIHAVQVRAGQQIQLGCVQFRVSLVGLNGDGGTSGVETESVSDVFEDSLVENDNLPFSAAERRVFDLLLLGHSEKAVADKLEISRHTVHSHVRKMYRLLGVRSRAELLARFVRQSIRAAVRPQNSVTQGSES
jgi:pSer/pThr/pTyr-binding forkhead associated (FHA) protein